ncbi:MAG TPA: phosphate/phosphite/phosphonate ABC transporter substrate-binding protein [Trebonia sp.]
MRRLRVPKWASLAAVAAVAIALVAGCSSSGSSSAGTAAKGTGNTVNSTWPTSITFGSVGESNATTLLQSMEPVVKLVQAKLDVKMNVVVGTSYSAMIEAQQAGKAQLVEYGPFSYYIAVNHGLKIQNVGLPITAPNTDGGYYSEAVVNPQKNPGINSLTDAAGKKVCFSDPASTSGYLYPSYGLLTDKISPTTGVTPVFAGSDSTTAIDAAQGSCQIGFTNSISLPLVYTQNHVSKSSLKVIWTSQEIPASPVAASDSLPASFRTALENVLVNDANSPYMAAHGYCSSAAQCTTITSQWGYAKPSLANYAPIAQICKVTKSSSCNFSS